MTDLLPLLLIAIVSIVAVAIVAFLRRRRRDAQEAAIVAASTPVPELSEDDIAWRIGVAGVDRPEGVAAAEAGAFDAAEREAGWEPNAAPAEPERVAAAVAVVPAVTAAPPRDRAEPLPNRWRLWRDSAAVLLIAVLMVLGLSIVSPWNGQRGDVTGTVSDVSSPEVDAQSPSSVPGVQATSEAPTVTLGPAVAFTPPPSTSATPDQGTPTPGVTPPVSGQSTPVPRDIPTAGPTTAPRTTPRPTATPRPTSTPRPTATP
ncbi:MAG TPA: hypothetical protein VKB30_02355, partial [Candidatus Limnocylindrales bacterium]|nr:hypothetical protein [Candidatus Limnocylindrales bacterium]